MDGNADSKVYLKQSNASCEGREWTCYGQSSPGWFQRGGRIHPVWWSHGSFQYRHKFCRGKLIALAALAQLPVLSTVLLEMALGDISARPNTHGSITIPAEEKTHTKTSKTSKKGGACVSSQKYGEHRDNILLLQASLLEEPVQGGRTMPEAVHGSQDI